MRFLRWLDSAVLDGVEAMGGLAVLISFFFAISALVIAVVALGIVTSKRTTVNQQTLQNTQASAGVDCNPTSVQQDFASVTGAPACDFVFQSIPLPKAHYVGSAKLTFHVPTQGGYLVWMGNGAIVVCPGGTVVNGTDFDIGLDFAAPSNCTSSS